MQTLLSDYACLKAIGVTGSYYRTTKSGNPGRRYKLAKQLDHMTRVKTITPERRNTIRAIAESRKKSKKPSFSERVARFFASVFSF